MVYFGSGDLWLFLPNDGIWDTLPDGKTYDRRKIAWFTKDYRWTSEPQPKLTVDAKRLNGSAQPVHSTGATNAFLAGRQESFMLSRIEFPATGC